ncbi:matrix metalloproteinase-17 isoform X2 [Bos taurus]|uniref:matrix metalloproteinase-17 isoform X2 n=1 Tax=Bos taurus TaxID=9913 RepID=UPI000D53404F|nr:matrix metalloproteinase-17 isoform X2 [Bos taurus]
MRRRAARGPGPPFPRAGVPPLPLLLLALAACGGCAAPAPHTEDLSLGVEWLSRFGYLPPADPETGQLQTPEELSKAIVAMQQFGGLEATGVLDEATLALMKTPRCSLPDLPAVALARRRRQAPALTKWNKRNLSWRVRTFPRDSPLGRDTVRALMHYALKVWSDITPLNFHEVAGSAADIQIDFSTADHNDRYPFDGPGGTVAHAFFPGDHHTAGDTHFDDDEAWTFRSSGVRESVSPTAQPDTPESEEPPLLPEPPDNRSSTLPRKDMPHRCSAHFDAVAQIRGEAFFFKGKYFWRLTRDRHLVSLQPAQVHRFWRGLPLHLDSVDAVYERTSDHKIVFFKGDRYWVFKDNNVEEGYPRPVSDFGLPSGGVDAAFSWAHNDKTYFFKDQLYWRYDEHTRRMDPGHPAQSPPWRGVPSTLDDAMRWSDGAAYFFRGKEYWKVLDGELEVAPGYPQSTARDWLVCRDLPADPEGMDGEAGAHARPGQRDHSRSEDAYEVCSCTSLAAPAPRAVGPLLAVLLSFLWTSAKALTL